MYANGMSMRAIFRTLNIPLGTIFTWIKRYGKKTLLELKRKWEEAKKDNKSTVRVVDEMWTYLRRRAKAFRK
jgi:transposase